MIDNHDTTAWLTAMREIETEGERTPAQCYDGEPLVNVGGIVLVPASRVTELLQDVA